MLSCADAEQMELCLDEMKRKKQAFLNQNPCTRVFHVLEEEKEKTKKERESHAKWVKRKFLNPAALPIGWTVLNHPMGNWRRDNLDLQNTKIWLCRLFFLALLRFSLTVIWLWLPWVCSLRRDRFCKLSLGQKLLEHSGVSDRLRINNCKTTINICLYWQRGQAPSWNDTSFFPEFCGGQGVWCLSNKSFWNKRSDQYQLSC